MLKKKLLAYIYYIQNKLKLAWFIGNPCSLKNIVNTLIHNYKIYGNTKQQLLPDGYTQLEYIESTGEQYIDTGFKANTTKTKFQGAFTPKSVQHICGLLGSRNSASAANDSSCNIFILDSSKFRFDWYNGTGEHIAGFGGITLNTKYDIEITRGKCSINGQTKTNTLTSSVDQDYNFYIGNFNNGGTAYTYGFTGYIWQCILYNEEIVVRNFIPAKRNSDDVVGMYDLVTKTFFTNAGTGSFVAGPIAPTPEAPIEIKSVGDKTKNLFDKSKAVHGDISSTTGQITSNIQYRFTSDFIKVNEGDNISFSGKFSVIGSETKYDCGWIKAFYDENKTFITGSRGIVQTPLTIPSNVKYIRLEGFHSEVSDTRIINLETLEVQVEQGSTATSYVPYGYQIPVVVSGKNLFDSTPYKVGYYINASGNEVEASSSPEAYLIRQARVQPSTQYTISLKGVESGFTQRIHAYDVAGNWLSQVATITTTPPGVTSSASFTTPANCAYIRQGGRSQTDYQLEQGSTATSYVPYYNATTDIYLSQPLSSIGISHGLPEGYQELSYIKSTGGACIDTGITYNSENNLTLEGYFQVPTETAYVKIVCGFSQGAGAWFGHSESGYWSIGGSTATSIKCTQKTKIKINWYNDIQTLFLNDISQYSRTVTTTILTDTLKIGSTIRPTYDVDNIIFPAKIIENNILVHNFIPAKRISDNEIGMYDLVTKTFFTNAGTGTFTAGPSIYHDYIDYENQKVYRQIGYKEFDGTENWVFRQTLGFNEAYLYEPTLRFKPGVTDMLIGISSHFRNITSGTLPVNSFKLCPYDTPTSKAMFDINIGDIADTLAGFKTWLASEYTNGTPVIIVYPLKTPAEETITLPQLQVPLGNSTVTVDTEVQPSDTGIQIQGEVND